MKNKPVPDVGSMSYYLHQMLNDLMKHGEYRVKWEWAIQEAEFFEKYHNDNQKAK